MEPFREPCSSSSVLLLFGSLQTAPQHSFLQWLILIVHDMNSPLFTE